MGVYNPHLPYILGQEWVDIRNEDITFSPSVNVVEIGHTFTPTANRILAQGKFYLNTPPITEVDGQVMLLAVYPTGREALSGPIESVVIPCNNAGITGSNSITSPPFGGFATAATVPPVLLSPGDGSYLSVTPNNAATAKTVALSFAVSQYSQLLTNKRIVKVELLQNLGWAPILQGTLTSASNPPVLDAVDSHLTIRRTGLSASPIMATYSPAIFYYNAGLNFAGGGGNAIPIGTPGSIPTTSVNLGEINPLSGVLTGVNSAKYPWRYEDLALFEIGAGSNRLSVVYEFGATSVADVDHWAGIFYLGYAALRVSFCEEQRVAYAGTSFGPTNVAGSSTASAFTNVEYVLGANSMPFVDTHYNINPTLNGGTQYTVTVSAPDIGDLNGPPVQINSSKPAASNAYPALNALRELATDPVHVGLKANLTQTVGDTFTREVTHVLPQLSLHASGGPLTEVHAYGRQAIAQIYGSNFANQNVLAAPVNPNQNFPWVRFYARRFGDTTVPLKLAGLDDGGLLLPGTSGSYASTPDNAALDVTGDIDIRIEMQLDDWTPAANISPITKWGAAGTRSYLLQIGTDGKLSIVWSTDGTNTFAATSSVAIPVVDGQRIAIRATLDVDNGAAGKTAKFYTAFAIATSYTQFGTDVISAGTTSIFSGSAEVEVGGHTNGTSDIFPGTVQAARILNGIGGTEVANPNFSSQATGTTSFTDAAGRVWTVNGNALITGPTSGSNVSITPAAFDQLPEILDGWKEVTLRFDTPPTMGISGASPTWQWTATGELAGNRWEVLGATAPALSGTPGALLTPAPNGSLSTVTYGQPSLGSLIELTWLPGYSVPVSGSTADPTSDAVLMFSQDAPAVTGFTVVTANQPLTGVALNCVAYPWYVPSAMAYNNVTWSPTSSSVPVTGFAYYELQRMDTIDTTWSTIAQLTSPSASGFKDFEARVAIVSSYRIRSVNELLFPGPWSSTITNSFLAPGVTGQGMRSDARTLLFTSNQAQNGARNLAYAIAGDSSGSEAFSFPEAGFTQFQFMYGRDYQTAFRPLERGGVTFQRTVLVQAAAISPPTLEDFVSLRDLAWDSLPYVCVRDEDGNRWFANVAIPQGAVKANNRTIYMADLTIVQVTNTPAITVV